MEKLLSANDVAKVFDMSLRWVYTHYRDLGGTRIGRNIFFTEEGIQDALSSGKEMESRSHGRGYKEAEAIRYKDGGQNVGDRGETVLEKAERHRIPLDLLGIS